MYFLSYIGDLFIDFLFPKSLGAKELETFSIDELAKILPQAQNFKEKHRLALFDYSHPLVKRIVWELKYAGNTKIAGKLGGILHDCLLHEIIELNFFDSSDWQRGKPALIPIPISDKRRFERGWNQSELLAKHIIKSDNNKTFEYLPDLLVKTRDTLSQVKAQSRPERLRNLTGSMAVSDKQKIAGRCVIVLDDVTTTGSTFAEARRALSSAGAKRILCVAVAH